MKLDKAYTPQEIDKWSFSQVCKFRTQVFDRFLKYNTTDMAMVNAGLKLIDGAYRAAVKVTLEGVEIDEAVLADLRVSNEDLQTITRYRALVMSRMAALPPQILRTMQILRTKFGNF